MKRNSVQLLFNMFCCEINNKQTKSHACIPLSLKKNPMHPLITALPCLMFWHVLLMMLWLLIGTHLHLSVEFLCRAEHLCPSPGLFGTILVTLCLVVWDLWILRSEPLLRLCSKPVAENAMLCSSFCLLLFSIFLHSMGCLRLGSLDW